MYAESLPAQSFHCWTRMQSKRCENVERCFFFFFCCFVRNDGTLIGWFHIGLHLWRGKRCVILLSVQDVFPPFESINLVFLVLLLCYKLVNLFRFFFSCVGRANTRWQTTFADWSLKCVHTKNMYNFCVHA